MSFLSERAFARGGGAGLDEFSKPDSSLSSFEKRKARKRKIQLAEALIKIKLFTFPRRDAVCEHRRNGRRCKS